MALRHSATTLLLTLALFVLFSPHQVVRADPARAASSVDAEIRGWIERAIAPDTGRGGIRLPEVWMDDSGDLTVVFALRERDDLDAFRAAAAEDVFDILRSVYDEPQSPVQTATVIGTYSVTATGNARELPVLRTVLSKEKAAGVDWTKAAPESLFTTADVYRLYPPFGDAQGNPIAAKDVSRTPSETDEDPVISSPINIGNGRLIFLRCIGTGSPTVILEAGYGDNGTIWAPVQIHASEFIRVCSYDRAGLERSDPPEHYPRTGADVVADLHAALQEAGVKPPYLLVGHSYGALFSRLFAATYPKEVAGMLLLDPWPEDFDSQLQAMVSAKQWTAYESMLAADPDNEVIDFPATYDEIRAAGPLPDVPLLVLSHGLAPTANCCPAGWPVDAQEKLWQHLEQGMAKLTAEGEERVVPDSGHMIHQAQPYVVVDAIKQMLDRIHGES